MKTEDTTSPQEFAENLPFGFLQDIIDDCHKTAVDKGWWQEGVGNRNFPEQLALQHSELSEVLEDYRDGKDFDHIEVDQVSGKPTGIPIEYADLLIRVFDTCAAHNIPLVEALRMKMEYNKSRPYRHGNKKA